MEQSGEGKLFEEPAKPTSVYKNTIRICVEPSKGSRGSLEGSDLRLVQIVPEEYFLQGLQKSTSKYYFWNLYFKDCGYTVSQVLLDRNENRDFC